VSANATRVRSKSMSKLIFIERACHLEFTNWRVVPLPNSAPYRIPVFAARCIRRAGDSPRSGSSGPEQARRRQYPCQCLEPGPAGPPAALSHSASSAGNFLIATEKVRFKPPPPLHRTRTERAKAGPFLAGCSRHRGRAHDKNRTARQWGYRRPSPGRINPTFFSMLIFVPNGADNRCSRSRMASALAGEAMEGTPLPAPRASTPRSIG